MLRCRTDISFAQGCWALQYSCFDEASHEIKQNYNNNKKQNKLARMQHLKEGKVARFFLALNSEAFDILDSCITELGSMDIQSVVTYSQLCKMHCVYVVAMFFCCDEL